jgi:probable rRNA maturation factor
MIAVRVDFPYWFIVKKGQVVAIARRTIWKVGPKGDPDLTIYLCNNHTIRRLNKQYRKMDRPTDVLSFGYAALLHNENDYLGDVVVSVQKAREQALENGHDLMSEICLLIAHGVLHLFGYDHDTPAKKRKMDDLQDMILRTKE